MFYENKIYGGRSKWQKFFYHIVVNTQMKVNKNIVKNEEDQFKTISEFKWCVDCGGEVEFQWKGKSYSIRLQRFGQGDSRIEEAA